MSCTLMPIIDQSDFPYPLRQIDSTSSIQTGDLNATSITSTQAQANTITASTTKLGGSTGQVQYTDSTGTTSFTGPGTLGLVLTSNGASAPTYQVLSIPTSTPNISGGLAGQIPVQTAPSTTSFIPTATSGYVLTSNGAGVAPSFQATVSPSTLPKVTILASGTSFTSTAGAVMMKVELYGAGGGGANTNNGTGIGGGGGGAGGYARGYFGPGTYAYVLGAAGLGTSTNGGSGTSGGTSTWSSGPNLMTVNGGAGGINANQMYGGSGAGASGPGVALAVTGGGGEAGGNFTGGAGGASYAGGGAAGAYTTIGSSASTGNNFGAVGSGGGGATGGSSNISGNGSAALLVITEYF